MTRTERSRRYRWSGYLLGFALGGFFDGILLHQILQWHHLLSAIETGDIRFQIAADGYFHALMYVIAAAGLWLLRRSWSEPDRPSGRLLFGNILIGFGVWHVVDSFISHWLIGIHRIRMDSTNPLFWDLFWFGIFGIIPLLIGWRMRRSGNDDGAGASGALSRSAAALIVVGAGVQALQPPRDSEFTTVLFAPGSSQDSIVGAIASVDGQLVWVDGSGEVVVIRTGDEQSALTLFRHGAILVSGAGLPPGCFDYLRT